MDNVKTGSLIKELRKSKSLTQKELAEILCVTDKAVSKWERGLCAPDISLLEPLAEALCTSIIELIGGERVMETEHIEKIEANAKNVLEYSKNEIEIKTRTARRKHLLVTSVSVLSVAVIVLVALWWIGYFNIIDKSVSPDGSITVTVYDRDVFSMDLCKPAISVLVREHGKGDLRITYENSVYQRLLWAPDSTKYVLSLKGYEFSNSTYNALVSFEHNSESNLNALLFAGVPMSELAAGDGVEYQVLQWSADSSAILVYYSFADVNSNHHSGYFWYDYENAEASAPFEIDIGK